MCRLEGQDMGHHFLVKVRDLQSEEGLLNAASWKEAGPGVGKRGNGRAPSGRGEFALPHTSAGEEGMLVT